MSPSLHQRLEAIAAVLPTAEDVLIVCHGHPDGDALGSSLALMHMLDALGVKNTLYNPDGVSASLAFLPGAERMTTELPERTFPWLVLLDCSTPDRVGPAFDAARPYERAIVLDHHLTERPFGDLAYVDRTAAATGEIVYRLATLLDWTPTPAFATCAFTALFTDTGGFRFANTSAQALSAAAALTAWGAEPTWVAEQITENQPERRLRVLAEVLDTLEIHGDGRVAVISVAQDVLDRHGATKDDLEGFVDLPRSIRGVLAAAQLREAEPGLVKASLRSKHHVSVEAVARRFGGGGHKHAAGCAVEGDLNAARDALIPALVAATRDDAD